ncbi:hypothetical protein HKD37_01G000587 [Glycine soja]
MVNITSAANLSTQMICLPMQNGTNLKVGKEAIERNDPLPLRKPLMRKKMCIMIMKRYTLEVFQVFISKGENAKKKILEEIEQYFAKNEKAEAINLLTKLVLMKYRARKSRHMKKECLKYGA